MINVTPWVELCVLAPVVGVADMSGAVVADYRTWANQPGNAIEVNGIRHKLGPMLVGRPVKVEHLGRWQVAAIWWPEMRR